MKMKSAAAALAAFAVIFTLTPDPAGAVTDADEARLQVRLQSLLREV